MHQYIADIASSEASSYYIKDNYGHPKEVSKTGLLTLAGNIGPFDILTTATKDSPEVKALSGAYFMYAFKVKISVPADYAPLTLNSPALPTVVTLGRNTSSVKYNLRCSEFQVVSATYESRGLIDWMNQSQPSGNA